MRRWRFDTWASWAVVVATAILLGVRGEVSPWVAIGIVGWFHWGYLVGYDQAQPVAPREHS